MRSLLRDGYTCFCWVAISPSCCLYLLLSTFSWFFRAWPIFLFTFLSLSSAFYSARPSAFSGLGRFFLFTFLSLSSAFYSARPSAFSGLGLFSFHLLPFVLCFFTHRAHLLFQGLSWLPFCIQSALTIVLLPPGPYQSFVSVKSPGENKTPQSGS